jgi:Rieske 2Fe-2S family protein
MYHLITPLKTDKTLISCGWLFSEGVVSSNKYDLSEAINFWDQTNKEDWYISEQSQLGINSKKYQPSLYSTQESLLAAFDRYYLKRINK